MILVRYCGRAAASNIFRIRQATWPRRARSAFFRRGKTGNRYWDFARQDDLAAIHRRCLHCRRPGAAWVPRV